MQRQLIGHNSLHNTVVACVQYVLNQLKCTMLKY
jgi:hypothetical protein